MSDTRTVATDALAMLGTIIDENAKRDAIHLAVIPMVAGHWMDPGPRRDRHRSQVPRSTKVLLLHVLIPRQRWLMSLAERDAGNRPPSSRRRLSRSSSLEGHAHWFMLRR